MDRFGYAALAGGVLVCGYILVHYKARQVTPEVAATVPSSVSVATDPAPASAEAPRPPAPLSPEPAAAELELLAVPSSLATSVSTDA